MPVVPGIQIFLSRSKALVPMAEAAAERIQIQALIQILALTPAQAQARKKMAFIPIWSSITTMIPQNGNMAKAKSTILFPMT